MGAKLRAGSRKRKLPFCTALYATYGTRRCRTGKAINNTAVELYLGDRTERCRHGWGSVQGHRLEFSVGCHDLLVSLRS